MFTETDITPEMQEILDSAANFLKILDLKPGFISDLVADSDWGFTIKCACLIEAAMEYAILKRFSIIDTNNSIDANLIQNMISRIPIDGRNSKIAYLNALQLTGKVSEKFVRNFFKLRNEYAHNIKNMEKSIKQICSEKNDKNLLKSLIIFDIDAEYFQEKDIKKIIALGVIIILYDLHTANNAPNTS